MLRRSGFNAVHLYLWDQPTFHDLYRKRTSRLQEISGFAYPDPALSIGRQWEAFDEFTGMAEKHNIWVIPHFVHTPFNEDLDSLSRTEVQQRAETIATWAGSFISRVSTRHTNILAWGALYALEPAPDDRPESPNNYSLLWRSCTLRSSGRSRPRAPASRRRFSHSCFCRQKEKNIWTPDAPFPRGAMQGYELDARIAKRRFASMKRHLSYEQGRTAEPDLVYTYLFGPDTAALERSIRELTSGKDAVPADRLFIAEYGVSVSLRCVPSCVHRVRGERRSHDRPRRPGGLAAAVPLRSPRHRSCQKRILDALRCGRTVVIPNLVFAGSTGLAERSLGPGFRRCGPWLQACLGDHPGISQRAAPCVRNPASGDCRSPK